MDPAPEPRGWEAPRPSGQPAPSPGTRGGPTGLGPAALTVVLLCAGALAVGLSALPGRSGTGMAPAGRPSSEAPRSAAPGGSGAALAAAAREASSGDLLPYAPPPSRSSPAPSPPTSAPAPQAAEVPRADAEELPPAAAARTPDAAEPRARPRLRVLNTLMDPQRKGGPFVKKLSAPAATPAAAACEGCANSTDAQFPNTAPLGMIPDGWVTDAGPGGGGYRPAPQAFTPDGSGAAPADWRNCPPKGR